MWWVQQSFGPEWPARCLRKLTACWGQGTAQEQLRSDAGQHMPQRLVSLRSRPVPPTILVCVAYACTG